MKRYIAVLSLVALAGCAGNMQMPPLSGRIFGGPGVEMPSSAYAPALPPLPPLPQMQLPQPVLLLP